MMQPSRAKLLAAIGRWAGLGNFRIFPSVGLASGSRAGRRRRGRKEEGKEEGGREEGGQEGGEEQGPVDGRGGGGGGGPQRQQSQVQNRYHAKIFVDRFFKKYININ